MLHKKKKTLKHTEQYSFSEKFFCLVLWKSYVNMTTQNHKESPQDNFSVSFIYIFTQIQFKLPEFESANDFIKYTHLEVSVNEKENQTQ